MRLSPKKVFAVPSAPPSSGLSWSPLGSELSKRKGGGHQAHEPGPRVCRAQQKRGRVPRSFPLSLTVLHSAGGGTEPHGTLFSSPQFTPWASPATRAPSLCPFARVPEGVTQTRIPGVCSRWDPSTRLRRSARVASSRTHARTAHTQLSRPKQKCKRYQDAALKYR